jgi:hypothetical protein
MSDKSPADAKLPSTFILLLVAFGFPAAAVSQLWEWALAHSWLVLGLSASWWALVGLGGFALKVWANRESAVLGWLDERIDRAWLRLFSGRRRVYLDHVADRCIRLRRGGLINRRAWIFRLDEVFVDIRLVPKAEGEVGTAIVPPDRTKTKIAGGRLSLWTLLDHDPARPLRLAILGGPGTGKTTLLDHVALRLAVGTGQPIPRCVSGRVPILIALRSHTGRVVDKPELSLPALVEADLPDTVRHSRTIVWIAQQLDQGRAIVMMDGLDEVADPIARKVVADWVNRQMLEFPRCSFILTSRPGGYRDNPLEAVELVAEVERFTAIQVRQFALQWFLADARREEHWLHMGASPRMTEAELERRARVRAPARADEFLGRLTDLPALNDFAGNPLLLRMMAEVHATGGTLGERRADLYGEIMTIALGRRREAKGLVLELGVEQTFAVAQPLALAMLRRGSSAVPMTYAEEIVRAPLAQVRPEMKPEQFLQSLEHDAGILLQREAGTVAFAHLTYQEYLAARQLGPTGSSEIISRLAEPAWRETVLFWAALHDSSPIMAALLREPTPTAQELELALRVQRDAKELATELRERLRALINNGCESGDSEIRTVVASALLSQRLVSLRPVNEIIAIDDDLITHVEYQLFLNDCRRRGQWRQPDHWTEPVFAPGSARSPVAGVRPADAVAFCAWLTERQGGAVRLRLPTSTEAAQYSLLRRAGEAHTIGYWSVDAKLHQNSDDVLEYAHYDISEFSKTMADKADDHLTSAIMIDEIFTLNSIAYLDHDRDLTRNRALTLDRDLTLSLNLTLNLDFDLALELARDLDLDVARDLARDLDLDPTSAQSFLASSANIAAGLAETEVIWGDSRDRRRRTYALFSLLFGMASITVDKRATGRLRTGPLSQLLRGTIGPRDFRQATRPQKRTGCALRIVMVVPARLPYWSIVASAVMRCRTKGSGSSGSG